MLVGVTDTDLCLLEFVDRRQLAAQVQRLRRRLGAVFVPDRNSLTTRTEQQLQEYFDRTRRDFDLPVALAGTAFQQRVWQALRQIPYGETRSYADLARHIGRPAAVRASSRLPRAPWMTPRLVSAVARGRSPPGWRQSSAARS